MKNINEDKWVQITIEDILTEEKPKKPVFSDDLWEEVQDMYEEWLITHSL